MQVARITLLVFDVDQLTDDQVDEIRGRIGSLRYLMHSTHSDSPNRRYLRIVIALSRPVLPKEWKAFFHTASQDLVPGADPACADLGRTYFLPTCPRDAIYFTQVNEGQPLNVDALLATTTSSQVAP
jgi:putative DNA primase/helicase